MTTGTEARQLKRKTTNQPLRPHWKEPVEAPHMAPRAHFRLGAQALVAEQGIGANVGQRKIGQPLFQLDVRHLDTLSPVLLEGLCSSSLSLGRSHPHPKGESSGDKVFFKVLGSSFAQLAAQDRSGLHPIMCWQFATLRGTQVSFEPRSS